MAFTWLSHWIPRDALFGVVVIEESSRTDTGGVARMGGGVRPEIWVVHQKDLSERHGETTHLVELSRALRTLGHAVRLIGPKVGRVPASVDAVQLQCVRDPRWIRLLTYEVALWLYFVRSWSVLRKRKPALYARKGALLLAPFAVGRLLGPRVVAEVNDVSREETPGGHASSLLRRLLCLVARIEYRMTDRMVEVTDAVKKEDVVDAYRVNAYKVVVIETDDQSREVLAELKRRLGLRAGRSLQQQFGVSFPNGDGRSHALSYLTLSQEQCSAIRTTGGGGFPMLWRPPQRQAATSSVQRSLAALRR